MHVVLPDNKIAYTLGEGIIYMNVLVGNVYEKTELTFQRSAMMIQLMSIAKRSYKESSTGLRHSYLFLFSQGIKRYRNTGGPPVRQGRTPSTQKIVSPESPDHPESSGNQGHDYENPEEMQMWPAPYNEIQRRPSYPVGLPIIPEPTEPNNTQQPIPRKNTGRRPSQQAPPVPLTRRPSGAIEVPGMFQPGGLPSTMGMKRKPSVDSSGANNVQVSQEHPPPLLPRKRSPSKISFDSTHDPELPFATSPPQRVETKETHAQYGNVASVTNEAFESHREAGEDALDAHGYVKCVHARDA